MFIDLILDWAIAPTIQAINVNKIIKKMNNYTRLLLLIYLK